MFYLANMPLPVVRSPLGLPLGDWELLPLPNARSGVELTGLNRTWGSAYLSARRTYRLGVLPAGRKYGLIRHPPLVLAKKMAGGTAVPSAGRKSGRTSVRPSRPAKGTV